MRKYYKDKYYKDTDYGQIEAREKLEAITKKFLKLLYLEWIREQKEN